MSTLRRYFATGVILTVCAIAFLIGGAAQAQDVRRSKPPLAAPGAGGTAPLAVRPLRTVDATPVSPPSVVDDIIGAYNFTVEINGITAGFFKGGDGLNAESEVLELQDGDDLVLRTRPGRSTFGDITLKKGSMVTDDLREWWEELRVGVYVERTISIHLHDNMQNRQRTWRLNGAWPTQWTINGFDGKGNDVLTEDITFVVEEIIIDE